MRNLIKFILFLIYTISIFFVSNYYFLLLIAILNIAIMSIVGINIKKSVNSLFKLLPFILFTVVINIIFADLKFAVLVGTRLILVCNISYTFSKVLTYTEFGKVIENIMYPLRIFGINPKEIGLIVTVALSFIPIIKDELQQIRNALKVKGIKSDNINLLKNINLIFKPFFISILQRLNEVEISLRAKGYQE